MKFLLYCILFIPFVSFNFAQEKVTHIGGIILDARDSTPVANAYVFFIRGEEEGLTNNEGKFRFVFTATKMPLRLTVQHPDYKSVTVEVKSNNDNKIFLRAL